MTKRSKFLFGFTLLEVLVVTAIIGLASSVTASYVSDARAKSRNAKIKTELISFRTQAEDYFTTTHLGIVGYGTVGSTTHENQGVVPSGPPYAGMCLDGQIIPITKSIAKYSKNDFFCKGGTSGATYVAYTVLFDGDPAYSLCLDNSGVIELVPTAGIITTGAVRCK